MQKRSNGTTALLVVALLGGLAAVGAVVKPKPAEPPVAPDTKPALAKEDPTKPTGLAKSPGEDEKNQKMAEINKRKSEFDKLTKQRTISQKNAEIYKDPMAMEIKSDYFRNYGDGTEGMKKLDTEIEAKKALQKKLAKPTNSDKMVAPAMPPPKFGTEGGDEPPAQPHTNGDGHNH